MTRLLVSVRNAEEAVNALRGGAALIDVKEPRRGSLGRAAAKQWQAVAQQVAGRVPVSVALGELLEPGILRHGARVPPVAFAKCGLSGCSRRDDWLARWQLLLESLPGGVAAVAVAYADWQHAAAPPPRDVLERARHLGCRAILWDTFQKGQGCLWDYLSPTHLQPLIGQARQYGLLVVLAGSLAPQHLADVARLQPDYVAVRGAVCEGARTGTVCEQRVRFWARALNEPLADAPQNRAIT